VVSSDTVAMYLTGQRAQRDCCIDGRARPGVGVEFGSLGSGLSMCVSISMVSLYVSKSQYPSAPGFLREGIDTDTFFLCFPMARSYMWICVCVCVYA
jgi:hypothetical protein